MRRKGISYPLLFVILAIALLGYYLTSHPLQLSGGAGGEDTPQTSDNQSVGGDGFTVCSFNIQTFGLSTMSCPNCVKEIISAVSLCDVVVVLEIRDASNTAFPELCKKLPAYDCAAGERKGRSTSKEQYGLVYRKGITLSSITESQDYEKWERPPSVFRIKYENTTYDLVALHSKPDDTPAELDFLDDYAATFGEHTIALGDFNQDGSYYSGTPIIFANWTKVIPDGCDSTVAASRNCYDRLYLNWQTAYTYGIYTNITVETSDHYMIYADLK